jgi:hypothetical protein
MTVLNQSHKVSEVAESSIPHNNQDCGTFTEAPKMPLKTSTELIDIEAEF